MEFFSLVAKYGCRMFLDTGPPFRYHTFTNPIYYSVFFS